MVRVRRAIHLTRYVRDRLLEAQKLVRQLEALGYPVPDDVEDERDRLSIQYQDRLGTGKDES
jgi:hypothetical protein